MESFLSLLVIVFLFSIADALFLKPLRQRRAYNDWYSGQKLTDPTLPPTFNSWLAQYHTSKANGIILHTPRTYTGHNTHTHPFADLQLDLLIEHCYTDHFDVWNYLGPRDAAPAKWRQHHALDHGMREA